MIETLKELFFRTHVSQEIDLKKIVRQKSSSYIKIVVNEKELSELSDELDSMDNYGLIKRLNINELIILPLGYALLASGSKEINLNIEYELLKNIYIEQCLQIVEPLNKDQFSELDLSLGLLILLTGSISNNNKFPFIKMDKSYKYFSAIKEMLDYICFRIFYSESDVPRELRDENELRNILGRNSKGGNLKRRINIHSVEKDGGRGVLYHWYETNNTYIQVSQILDGLLGDLRQAVIPLLNLKKIAMDHLLINPLPIEMKIELGERTFRIKVLEYIILYVNSKINGLSENLIQPISKQELFSKINAPQDIKDIKSLFLDLTKIIENYPQNGMYLIEIHYRLAKVIQLQDVELLGEDFNDLLEDNKQSFISSILM